MDSHPWGRNLLATVGAVLILAGLMLLAAPFVVRSSGLLGWPGVVVIPFGVLLVVLSAFYDSSGGRGQLMGWSVRFGSNDPGEIDETECAGAGETESTEETADDDRR